MTFNAHAPFVLVLYEQTTHSTRGSCMGFSQSLSVTTKVRILLKLTLML